MIIVADCHVNSQTESEFRAFLEHLDGVSCPVVFLGDIFQLWIALPDYEERLHHDFLQWCRDQQREVGWVDGNREYFVSDTHADAFAWSTDANHQRGRDLFCHGDLVNVGDKRYRYFRKALRNPLSRFILCHCPLGKRLALRAEVTMRSANRAFSKRLPEEQLRQFVSTGVPADIRRVFMGHFHKFKVLSSSPAARELILVPAWCEEGRVLFCDGDREPRAIPWREVPQTGLGTPCGDNGRAMPGTSE